MAIGWDGNNQKVTILRVMITVPYFIQRGYEADF